MFLELLRLFSSLVFPFTLTFTFTLTVFKREFDLELAMLGELVFALALLSCCTFDRRISLDTRLVLEPIEDLNSSGLDGYLTVSKFWLFWTFCRGWWVGLDWLNPLEVLRSLSFLEKLRNFMEGLEGLEEVWSGLDSYWAMSYLRFFFMASNLIALLRIRST